VLERSITILKYLKTTDSGTVAIDSLEAGCWVSLVKPTIEEIDIVSREIGIDKDLLSPALDEEERSRIEHDEDANQTLVLVDTPLMQEENTTHFYTTLPMGIILCKDYIVTVCGHDSEIIKMFIDGRVKNFFTQKKTRFVFQLLYRNAVRYLYFLRLIDRESNQITPKCRNPIETKSYCR